MEEKSLSEEIINARSTQLTDKVLRVPKVRESIKRFDKRLKEEIDFVFKLNILNARGCREPLKTQVLDLVAGCLQEVIDQVDKIKLEEFGKKLT